MRKSEIFDSFVKIAQEKGLISEDAPEKAIKILEKNPRAGSLDAAAIAKLYGLKPDAPKDMQYEKNIVENAHPNPVVVAPSYDKLNGLVENLNERQNILLHIVNKETNGLSTQHKYAEKDLILSLVRVANDLDNRNEEELRLLADACLWQVSSDPLKKQGALPALLLNPVTGIAAMLGALYLQQHMNFVNEGFKVNHQKLVSELDDFLNSNTNFGIGYQYTPQFLKMVQDFKGKLEAFYNLYSKVEPVISDLETPRTAKELMELSQKPASGEVIQSYQALKEATKQIVPYVLKVAEDFKSESFKSRQIQDKGFISSLVDKTQVLHGGKGLVADDFDDVARAIPPYLKSLQDLANILEKAGSLQEQAQNDLQASYTKTDELFGGNKPSPGVKEIDDSTDQLVSNEKDLSDLLGV